MRARPIALLIALALGISLSAALAPGDATDTPIVLPQVHLPRTHFIQYEIAEQAPMGRKTARVEMLRLELECTDTERCMALAFPAPKRERPRLEF